QHAATDPANDQAGGPVVAAAVVAIVGSTIDPIVPSEPARRVAAIIAAVVTCRVPVPDTRLPAVATILTAVPFVLTPIPPILTPVAPVLATVPFIFVAVATILALRHRRSRQ